MFGMNKNSVYDAYNQLAHAVKDAKPGEAVEASRDTIKSAVLGASYADTKPSRPGDTPPRPFVSRTLDTLNKTLESYSVERDLLAKDIAKLTEEHAQVLRALSAVSAAISSLENDQPTEATVSDAMVSAVSDELSNARPAV